MKPLFYCISLGRLAGVPLCAHFTWFIWPIGIPLGVAWWDGGWRGLLYGAGVLLLVIASVLCHEFAHVLAARHCGIGTTQVVLIPIGCVADLEAPPREPWEIWVAAAGPLASLCLSLLCGLGVLLLRSPNEPCWRDPDEITLPMLATFVCTFNLMAALFNLLPCFPMDGGRIARSLLAVAIGRLFPGRAHQAYLLATRIAVHYIALPLVLGIALLTVFLPQMWFHLAIFIFLYLAGEAEWRLLRALEVQAAPATLALLPASSAKDRQSRSSPRPQRLLHADIIAVARA